MRDLHFKISDFDLYAVSAGPGSFTGLRIGLTAVKGWSELFAKPIAPVSALHALSAQGNPQRKLIASVMDARRGQIFGGIYRRDGAELNLASEEVVARPDEFIQEVARFAGSEPVAFVTPSPDLITSAIENSALRGSSIESVSEDLAPWIGKIGRQLSLSGDVVDCPFARRQLCSPFGRRIVLERIVNRQIELISNLIMSPSRKFLVCANGARRCRDSYSNSIASSKALRIGRKATTPAPPLQAPASKGWVAEVDEKVIAFLIARTTFGEMEILNLAVSGIYRRRGIATKLLAERLGTLEHSSTKVAFLEVRESNAAARSFYAKTGFRETGRRPKYYNIPTEDAIVLRRDLAQSK